MEGKYLIEKNQSAAFVGLVCLDIIQILEKFPTEDLGHRCLDCKWQRGGNASNSATVFALLGGKSCFFGTLADSDEINFLVNDFKKYNIQFKDCPKISNSTCPLSIVILSKSSGSRTVLHTNKNLRELAHEDLRTNLDLSNGSLGWIHFEGRDNGQNIFHMLNYIKEFNESCGSRSSSDSAAASQSNEPRVRIKPIKVSLEAEKLRFAPEMDKYNLWSLPDVLFVSKDFAKNQGYHNMTDAAQSYFKRVRKDAVVICAWGEFGAAAMSIDGLVQSPAFPPPEIIDSCGAGDTFNAAVIHALSSGKSLHDAIRFGCKVAGAKCGILGYNGMESTLDL